MGHYFYLHMILDALHRIANHNESLARAEAREVMAEVLAGNCTDAQIAALLLALRMKGETVEEIVGFAEAIRAAATPLPISMGENDSEKTSASGAIDLSGTGRDALGESSLVDTSGTGGDACGTFNISTATAFVTAGAGVRVAKHGNRSISSKCGSADVMEALGVNIQLSPERAAECLREVGICFLYAPDLHSSMKQVQKVRRELRLRTMFNLLGPLTNPARASGQVVGVYALEMVEKLAEALSMLGLHRALVVHGLDGLDEITITGATRVAEARDGIVRTYEVDPEEFGMKRASLADISGGDAKENAAIVLEVLSGKKSPRRDVVLLNAAAALVAAGCVDHLANGIPLAVRSIDSGAAAGKLEKLASFTVGR
ncbi:MAG: anthranilate phosphoribosyltransferase [Candidatus Sulfotelmatobacter sp.]|nr:anthranilate phosphoribosyltransferase [Candidatus Sulfotelmatobacter sp.]